MNDMLDGFDHPAPLSVHYTHFDVANRLFLTGHSHQAWPDVALEGQRQAWLDAAEMLDGKWSVVAEKVEQVTEGYRALMSDCSGDITLDTNTHALVARFLSALPLRERPRIVTTDGEFHSIRR
ncbi:MAG TPA: kynureninase, partial [Gemmatimonadetes bacterium]|nr:kynureninase [Gemmatimonadota bacterium]